MVYRVEHVATVETRLQTETQTSKSRSESQRSWLVTGADGETIEVASRLEFVDMWSVVSGQEVVRYNSRTDKEPPATYSHVADSIGVTLAKITIDTHGQVLDREDAVQQVEVGLGGVSIPLPAEPIPVGFSWNVPHAVKLRADDGRIVTIKTRQRYGLERVSAGVATISVKTQILTPLHDPTLRSQLVQRLSNGEIKFDIDAGRIIRRQLDWDETVIGFRGADSNMKYLARLIEELVPARTARQESQAQSR